MRLPCRSLIACLAVCLAALAPPLALASEAVDSGGTDLQLNCLGEASRAAYHGRYTEAVNRASAVIAEAPNFADAYFARANFLAEAGRFPEALADLDRVAGFHPDARQVYFLRTEIDLRQHNPSLALTDLAKASNTSAMSVWKQNYESGLNESGRGIWHLQTVHQTSYLFAFASVAEEMLGHDDAALHDLNEMMKNETEEPYYVLARHCYYAAVAGLAEMAELTCNQAIAAQSHDIGDYDSLGLAHLKMKAWTKAINDYNQALYTKPDLTVSLYGRGLAKLALGDVAGGNADIASATKGEPDIVNVMAKLGVGK